MLSLTKLDTAKDLSSQPRGWRKKREIVAASSTGFNLSIASTYQDDDMLEALQPAVLAYIDAKIAGVIAALLELGVDPQS